MSGQFLIRINFISCSEQYFRPSFGGPNKRSEHFLLASLLQVIPGGIVIMLSTRYTKHLFFPVCYNSQLKQASLVRL